MEHKEKVKDIFSLSHDARKWSSLYDGAADVFEDTMLLRRDYVLNYILRNFDVSAKILELGCGAGVLIEKLLGHGMSAVGMDLSRDMLSLAGKRLAPYPQEKNLLLQGDCETLPFGEGRFDLVVCLGVISFLRDEGQALSEMRRALREKGTLIISVRNKYTFSTLSDPVKLTKVMLSKLSGLAKIKRAAPSRPYLESVPIPRIFNPFRLRERLEKSGFAVREIKQIGYGPIMINNRELLPRRLSIRLSRFLEKAFTASHLEMLKWSSDVWVFVAEKKG